MILTLMAINAHAQQSIPISGRVLDAETMDEVKEDTQRLYYIAN